MLTGNQLDFALQLLVVIVLGVGVAAVTRRAPKIGVTLWIVTLCFVPIWFGLDVGPYWPPTTLVGLLLIFSAARLRVPHLTVWDAAVVVFALVAVVGFAIGSNTLSQAFTVIVIWMVPFVAARMALTTVGSQWIYDLVAVCFTVVAVLAIVEFLTSFNPFVLLKVSGEQYSIWAPLQARGGLLRVEGAFGHPIALGASLALAIPLTIASRFPVAVRVIATMLMTTATVLTFSRIGMICAVLAIILSVVFVREGIPRSLRLSLVATGAALGLAASPLIAQVFAAAGAEASNSALYRGDLTSLIPQFDLLGLSSAFSKSTAGAVFFGDFRSIDSELILAGLTYGFLGVAILIGLLIAAAIVVLLRRATPPTVALVAQIPGFASVALITQYSAFVWFMAGLAIASQVTIARSRAAADAGLRIPSAPLVGSHLPLRHLLPSSSRSVTALSESIPYPTVLRGTHHGTS